MENATVNGPIIIAMKGLPYTGKSTLAQELAKVFKCPMIDLDHVRGGMARAQQSLLTSGTSGSELLDDLCYEVLCEIALVQLSLGFKIIIDSPLSSRSNLDRLLQLSTSTGAPLVVIECKPQDLYEFRKRLERAEPEENGYLFEKWTTYSLASEHYKDYNMGDVSKLVVDTSSYLRVLDLRRAIDYAAQNGGLSLNFVDWKGDGFRPIEEDRKEDNEKNARVIHIHKLLLSDEQHTGRCEACLEPISGSFYRCDGCGLSVHRLCAEQPEKKVLQPEYNPPLQAVLHDYSFPVRHRCEAHHKDLLECSGCLFETYLQHALLPSVIHHWCHDHHPLNLTFYPFSFRYMFRCEACGNVGQHVLYECSECGFQCHVDCALLPYRAKQFHHRHTLSLTPPHQEFDFDSDHFCDACEDEINSLNPKHWSYSCPDCNAFKCHLKCITFEG